jgi:hypothetical protein
MSQKAFGDNGDTFMGRFCIDDVVRKIDSESTVDLEVNQA